MERNRQDIPLADWPKVPSLLNEIGKRLRERYENEAIPSQLIKREVERLGGYAPNSVLPSDYCYNLINKASLSFVYRIFIHEGTGEYRYVGPNYPHSGPIMWKPKGKPQIRVGLWTSGTYVLEHDPRH